MRGPIEEEQMQPTTTLPEVVATPPPPLPPAVVAVAVAAIVAVAAPTPAPKHNLMIGHPPPKRVVKNITRKKGANKRKANGGITWKKKTPRRKKTAEIEQVGISFAAAFPPPKSPHQHCTYIDCQIEGHMFYKKSSETCNKETYILELHHVCMIECGTNTYGEEGGERMGMKKLCKSCMIKTATDMGIKRV